MVLFSWDYFFMGLRSVSCFPMVCLCAPFSSNLFSKKLSVQNSIRTRVTAARTQCPDHKTIWTSVRTHEMNSHWTNRSGSNFGLTFLNNLLNFCQSTLRTAFLGLLFLGFDKRDFYLLCTVCLLPLPIVSFDKSYLSRPGFEHGLLRPQRIALTTRPSGLA